MFVVSDWVLLNLTSCYWGFGEGGNGKVCIGSLVPQEGCRSFHPNPSQVLSLSLSLFLSLSLGFFFLFNLFLKWVFFSVIELEIDEILMGLCLIAHYFNSFIVIEHFPCLILVILGAISIEFSVETA